MNTYTPDVWVVLEFKTTEAETPVRKVFAGWYGGFAGSDMWKLNSGITKVRKDGAWWEFDGYSGSVYRCHKDNYQMSGLMHSILARWQKQAEALGATIRILTIDEIVES